MAKSIPPVMPEPTLEQMYYTDLVEVGTWPTDIQIDFRLRTRLLIRIALSYEDATYLAAQIQHGLDDYAEIRGYPVMTWEEMVERGMVRRTQLFENDQRPPEAGEPALKVTTVDGPDIPPPVYASTVGVTFRPADMQINFYRHRQILASVFMAYEVGGSLLYDLDLAFERYAKVRGHVIDTYADLYSRFKEVIDAEQAARDGGEDKTDETEPA